MKGRKIVNALAFFSLLILALLLTIKYLFPLIGINIQWDVFNVLETIQNVFVLIVIATCAYSFVANKAKWVIVVYWISIVIFIVAVVLMWVK